MSDRDIEEHNRRLAERAESMSKIDKLTDSEVEVLCRALDLLMHYVQEHEKNPRHLQGNEFALENLTLAIEDAEIVLHRLRA